MFVALWDLTTFLIRKRPTLLLNLHIIWGETSFRECAGMFDLQGFINLVTLSNYCVVLSKTVEKYEGNLVCLGHNKGQISCIYPGLPSLPTAIATLEEGGRWGKMCDLWKKNMWITVWLWHTHTYSESSPTPLSMLSPTCIHNNKSQGSCNTHTCKWLCIYSMVIRGGHGWVSASWIPWRKCLQ